MEIGVIFHVFQSEKKICQMNMSRIPIGVNVNFQFTDQILRYIQFMCDSLNLNNDSCRKIFVVEFQSFEIT